VQGKTWALENLRGVSIGYFKKFLQKVVEKSKTGRFTVRDKKRFNRSTRFLVIRFQSRDIKTLKLLLVVGD